MTLDIIFIGYKKIHNGMGLKLSFTINEILYERVSMLKDAGFFTKGQLLWWIKERRTFIGKEDENDLEDMAEIYFKTYQPVNLLSSTATHPDPSTHASQ